MDVVLIYERVFMFTREAAHVYYVIYCSMVGYYIVCDGIAVVGICFFSCS